MGLGMMHARKYAAYNAAKRANSLKQGRLTKATNELPTAAKVRTPIGMREEQLATDARRQRMLEENGAGLQKIGAAKDENARPIRGSYGSTNR
jgi:E3 ubiquitin-protein ligase DOA10